MPLAALFTAKLISTFGSWLTVLALPWFVLVTSGSPTRMSAVLTVEFLGVVLVGIPSGRLVQRLGARRTMLLGDAARAPLMALVPLLHAAGLLSFPALLAISFGLGLFTAPYIASQRLILPDLLAAAPTREPRSALSRIGRQRVRARRVIGEDDAPAGEGRLARANSLIDAATRIGALAGPALGGVLIGRSGTRRRSWPRRATGPRPRPSWLLFVHVPPRAPHPTDPRPGSPDLADLADRPRSTGARPGSPDLADLADLADRPGRPDSASQPGITDHPPTADSSELADESDRSGKSAAPDLLAGLRHVVRHRSLRLFLAALLLIALATPAIFACLPVLVLHDLGGDPRVLGLLTASNGAGLAAGGILALLVIARLRDTALALAAVVLALPLWLLLTSRISLLAVALFLSGLATPLCAATLNTRFTLRTPTPIRPQVLTAVTTAENLAAFLAFAAAGPVLQAAGLKPVFTAIATLATLGAVTYCAALRADTRTPPAAPAPASRRTKPHDPVPSQAPSR
ncbi:MFS transporter [Actinoplanes awajinensis]|uniref:Major facilitator superfamily (MFS) profile domain-containing protein n=1 Tax=Actinoplanes awajinensis subsp. mycoplanecinus TaxID=135947 RepID=A0A0X3V2Z9_9ACTN|nr:MFS transporter [Actinoplanes awajinensis]KUL37616.1 hypothetical protein ADL15_11365 [Actinoplanes awajinensis subsp. mycoplanecinus]